ncbi:hypothetical protein [Minwuia sp.]|uniref:hypothetical protein n=1 Tax=Minwuia sp. TaxID=2493630 RepID=UPI003A919677
MMMAHFAIQTDVVDRFSVAERRVFRNVDGQTYAVVGHNRELGLLTDIWFGTYGSEDNFRSVLEYMCEQFETGDYRLWLADLRFLSQSFFDAQQYLVEEACPRAIRAGLAREAVVMRPAEDVPEGFNVFGSAHAALQQIADGRVRGFTDMDMAREWLINGTLPDRLR